MLANIYLGKVNKWNDPAIAVSNPGRSLYPMSQSRSSIVSDGSGTTAIWTEFLAKSSSAWKSQIGAGNKVSWPAGIAAEKNDGVADTISRTVGAIGYVELTYALANGLLVGQVKNQAGEFIEPSVDALAATGASLREIPADLRYSLVDAGGNGLVSDCRHVLDCFARGPDGRAWSRTRSVLALGHDGRSNASGKPPLRPPSHGVLRTNYDVAGQGYDCQVIELQRRAPCISWASRKHTRRCPTNADRPLWRCNTRSISDSRGQEMHGQARGIPYERKITA